MRREVFYHKVVLSIVTVLFFTNVISAKPVVESIIHSPDKPLPEEEVIFEAKVHGKNITSVNIIVKECQEKGVCFLDFQNVSMEDKGNNTYSAVVKLMHPDATKVEYYLNIKSDGVWYRSNITKFNLSIEDNISEESSKENESPGFETFLLIISLTLFVLVRRRIPK